MSNDKPTTALPARCKSCGADCEFDLTPCPSCGASADAAPAPLPKEVAADLEEATNVLRKVQEVLRNEDLLFAAEGLRSVFHVLSRHADLTRRLAEAEADLRQSRATESGLLGTNFKLMGDTSKAKCAEETAIASAKAAKIRGDNHAETLRGVRGILSGKAPDIKRALLWVSDGLFGYSEPLEATLLKANDERNEAVSRAESAEARVRELEFYRADALKEMRQQLELLSAYHVEGVTARIGSVLARVRELEAFKSRVLEWARSDCYKERVCGNHKNGKCVTVDGVCRSGFKDGTLDNWAPPKAWGVGE